MTARLPLADILRDAKLYTDGDWVESKDQDVNGDVRLTQLADVGDGEWLNRSNRYMTSTKAAALKCTILKAGDLLVARMPDPLGRCCVFPGYTMPCVTVVDVCVIRPNTKRVFPRYLMHAINAPATRSAMQQFVVGTTRPRISRKNIGNVPVPLPPLADQKQITGMLDSASRLRAKRRESIEQLDSLVQAMFLEMFGDPVTNPMGWDVVKSARLFSEKPKIGTTKKADGKGYLVVRVGEIGNAQIQFSDCSRVELKKAEFDRYVLQRGDTVIARAIGSKAQLGKASFFDGFSEDVVVDSHVMRLRTDSTVCDSKWFYTLISSTRGKILLQSKGGATAVQFNINAKQVSDIDIPLPPVGLQTRFAAIVDSIEQKKAQLKAHLGELDTLFASLQSRAFKGPPNP